MIKKKTPSTKKTLSKPRVVLKDEEQLPSYNQTKVTLIARDPFWIYAYWDIAPGDIDRLRHELGSKIEHATYILRLYDVTYKQFDGHNANHWFDIEISTMTNNWYINLWDDNVTYCAAIGIKTSDGEFHILARSNFVTTPRAHTSGRSDLIWMEVEPAEEPLVEKPFIFITPKGGGHKPSRQRIDLTIDDIRSYYYRLFPLLKLLKAKKLSAHEALLRGLSLKDLEQARRELLTELQPFGASEMLGASETTQQQPKPFAFEIGTELIVYGRTDPQASVYLEGKKIDLHPDGTFSFKMPLLNGAHIPLNFVAVSNDQKECRIISTSAQRAKTEKKKKKE